MFSISITQVAAGIGGIAWLFRTHLTENWQEQRWPLGIPLALFTLACIVAVIFAYDTSYSYKELKKLFKILIFFWVGKCPTLKVYIIWTKTNNPPGWPYGNQI